MAASREQGGVPYGDVGRPQFLKPKTAEQGRDLQVDELAITFAGFGREVTILIEPCCEIARDGLCRWVYVGAVVQRAEPLAKLAFRVPLRAPDRDINTLAAAAVAGD